MRIFKNISWLFLIICLILFAYLYYQSSIVHLGKKNSYYLSIFYILLIFFVFSIFSFLIKNETKNKIALILSSFYLSFFLIELYLSLIFFNNFKDGNNLKDFYNGYKKINDKAVIAFSPKYFLSSKEYSLLPLSLASNSETILCNENGYYAIYQSDRYGFNNPDKEWEKEIIDYMLIGDSLVQGNCVNEKDTIAANIRNLLKDKNSGVLNLGMAANGPLLEYATLKEYFKIKSPKNVLWIYSEANDLTDLSDELSDFILNQYYKNIDYSQELSKKQKLINRKILSAIEESRANSKFSNFSIRNAILLENLRRVTIYRSISEAPLDDLRSILSLARDYLSKNSSQLYFVYIPEYARFNEVIKYNDKNYLKVINLVKDLNIPIIDLYSEFFENYHDPKSLYPNKNNGHFTESGYRMVTEIIYKKIIEINNK
jgi:hypothetical protein